MNVCVKAPTDMIWSLDPGSFMMITTLGYRLSADQDVFTFHSQVGLSKTNEHNERSSPLLYVVSSRRSTLL